MLSLQAKLDIFLVAMIHTEEFHARASFLFLARQANPRWTCVRYLPPHQTISILYFSLAKNLLCERTAVTLHLGKSAN